LVGDTQACRFDCQLAARGADGTERDSPSRRVKCSPAAGSRTAISDARTTTWREREATPRSTQQGVVVACCRTRGGRLRADGRLGRSFP